MARLSVNELTTYRWTFEEDVARYAAAGFAAIGVWRQKICDFGEEKGAELLSDSGLAVSNLLWAGGFTGSDGRSYRDSIDDGIEAVQLAGMLRCPCLVVYSGGRAGHTHNHARRLLIGALNELAPLAAQHGVTLALEPMHPGCAAEWTFLSTINDALDVIQRVGSPQVKLAFDTYHFGHDGAIVERLEKLAPQVAIVHLGDGKQEPDGEQNRCALGQGQVPLAGIIAALARGGYQGYYDIELMGEEVEGSQYEQLLRDSKRVCGELFSE
ncbi:MAG: sugar phosphate isomerase/epimerase [Planctomycetia bacterium]|nr:sugar phosphate isomerase/epimerase [Planctomycetia bacterium]